MTAQELFFYDHGVCSYDPATETPESGRVRYAKNLAVAELFAQELDWTFDWQDDQDSCIGCDCGSDDCACCSGSPHECLSCVLRANDGDYADNRDGTVLASLSAICEPSREYRRVVEAELASEAMYNELKTAAMMHV